MLHLQIATLGIPHVWTIPSMTSMMCQKLRLHNATSNTTSDQSFCALLWVKNFIHKSFHRCSVPDLWFSHLHCLMGAVFVISQISLKMSAPLMRCQGEGAASLDASGIWPSISWGTQFQPLPKKKTWAIVFCPGQGFLLMDSKPMGLDLV